MGKINVLSFAVANLIAAGEVVDRPASVIKELLENAIDAGATKVTVEIQRGGVSFMRVTDNGCGIPPEDLPVAIRRHATSKIKDAGDLDGIMTLGFRGEALAAIAAVSHLRILTRPADDELGNLLEAEGGNVVRVTEQGCAKGTTVIVEELFANVPARRKFLKKDSAETMAVTAIVERVALSRPDIAFSLITDGSRRFDTAGDGQLEHTIHAVFGRDFARRMIAVKGSFGGIGVTGFVGRSDNIKTNRNYQNFFINGRYVKSKTAAAALEQAYTSYIAPERYPVCVLCIALNPGAVDVNVHPAKLEVKFSNEKIVFEAVYGAVRSALTANQARPELELAAEGEKPVNANTYKNTLSLPPRSYLPLRDGTAQPTRQLSVDSLPQTSAPDRKASASVPSDRMNADEYRAAVALPPRAQTAQRTERPALKSTMQPAGSSTPHSCAPLTRDEVWPIHGEEVLHRTQQPADRTDTAQTVKPAEIPAGEKAENLVAAQKQPLPPLLPTYRIIGEAFNCYILVERGDTLLLIDKHAAHERILFEEFKGKLGQVDGAAQLLLTPIALELTAEECGALTDYRAELEEIGFAYAVEGARVKLTQIPNGVTTTVAPDLFGLIAAQLVAGTGDVKLTRDLLFERALYQASCKSAIKGGRAYPEGHIEWLCERLLALPDITVCPHGRPVAIELTHRALDKQFSRE